MDPRYKTPTAEVADQPLEGEFRDLGRFTTVLVWMLRVGVLLAVFNLWSSLLQLELLSRDFTQAEGAANDLRVAYVTGAFGLLTIATFFVFGRWIVLAHRNLPAMGAQILEYRPGWALAWFFIPVANLWKPYQAMKSLWMYSHSVFRPDVQDRGWVLPVWWTLWLVSSFIGNAEFRTSFGANTVATLETSTQITLVGCIVDVFLYSVAAILVGRIWKAQATQRANPTEFEPAKGFAD
jgi:hypothetical protein